MSRVLVTGANGYIGKHVVRVLLDMGQEVLASDINPIGIDSRATVVPPPIFSGDRDIYAQLGSPDVCIHMAWRNGFVHNAPTHMGELSDHIAFCQNMVAGGLRSLSVMGTMHEIGYWEGAIDAGTPCNPQTQYGIAKNAMRQSLMLATAQGDCALHWLRAYYIVSNDAGGSNIFSKIMQAARDGRKVFPFTSGKNQYDFIDIGALAKMIAAASLQTDETGIINVCSGFPESLADRVERFIQENRLDIRLDYGKFPDRPYDSPAVWGDAAIIKRIMSK